MSDYKISTDKIIYGERALCTYLVQEHHESCHEEDLVRIAELCARFWIEKLPDAGPYIPTVAERQAQVWESIKRHRDTLEDGGVLVAGKWWHTDIKSRAKYLGLMHMGAAVDGIQWKTMDGTMQALSQALVAQVFQGVAIADTTNFANAEAHRVAMVQVEIPEDYDYTTGWTGSYQA